MHFRARFLQTLLLALPLALHAGLASAQGSPASSGSYFQDLGKLVAEIRGAQWTADICAELHPATKAANQAALDNWRQRYKPFIDEMTAEFDRLPAFWAAQDPASAANVPELFEKVNKFVGSGRDRLRKQYLQSGTEQRQFTCALYPQELGQPRWDLEHYRINEVARIRRGPNG